LTTGLVGLDVQPHGREILIKLYEKIMDSLKDLPADNPLKQFYAEIIDKRMPVLQSVTNIFELEKHLDCGQIEEMIVDAQNQLDHILPMMLKEQPWKTTKWHNIPIIHSEVK
jgi:NADH dehydrogenase (ubiquinone) 1 alpha subcomplex subunit 5